MEELKWVPIKFAFLRKVKDKKVNCNISYFLVQCGVYKGSLVLGERQAMRWFSIGEISRLSNINNNVYRIIFEVNKHINCL